MKAIATKIVSYKVKEVDAVTNTEVTMPVLLRREDNLSGTTYKIHPSNEDHSYYITINNTVANGKIVPFEVFINSKNVTHFQWISALTRLISAIFRHGGKIDFLVEELTCISDPNSGYWGKDKVTGKGKYYNSLVHEIGEVIREHVNSLENADAN